MLRLRTRWFQAILAGTKDIEGRIARHPFTRLEPGDEVCLRCEGGEMARAHVVALHRAPTFKILYERFGERLLPHACLTDAEQTEPWTVYDAILDYKEAIESGLEALGIELKVGAAPAPMPPRP